MTYIITTAAATYKALSRIVHLLQLKAVLIGERFSQRLSQGIGRQHAQFVEFELRENHLDKYVEGNVNHI